MTDAPKLMHVGIYAGCTNEVAYQNVPKLSHVDASDGSLILWHTYHHDAEVQRLVAEARAEAIAEILRIVTAYRKEAGQRADGKTFQALDDLRWDLRDLADQSNDAPPRQVTPQEADVSAAYLLEWMTYHHLPLQLWREDEGSWVIVDNSTGSVWGSGETAEIALRAALRALASGGDSDE